MCGEMSGRNHCEDPAETVVLLERQLANATARLDQLNAELRDMELVIQRLEYIVKGEEDGS